MPKVYLTAAARTAAAETRQNEAFTWALKTVRARLGQTYTATAEAVGVSRNTICLLTNPETVSTAKFGTIRDVAHAVKMTREEWLRLGGFDK